MNPPTSLNRPLVGRASLTVDALRVAAHLPKKPLPARHDGTVTALAYSHDGKLLATGSHSNSEEYTMSGYHDKLIFIWDASNAAHIQSFKNTLANYHCAVSMLAFSPDGKRIASADTRGCIQVWCIRTGIYLKTLVKPKKPTESRAHYAIAWSADGKWIASGSDDLGVRLWDAETYEQKMVFEGHQANITFLCFSHNSRWLASCAADHCGRIWDVRARAAHAVLRGHSGTLLHADFDADDQRLVTCSDDGTARIWNVQGQRSARVESTDSSNGVKAGDLLVEIHEHHSPVQTVAFSRDGIPVLAASSDSIDLFDSLTGQHKLALSGHRGEIHAACFSPDGKYVASASSDGTVRLWRTADGTHLEAFDEHDDEVKLVAFSPNGETLASAADDGTVRIRPMHEWDPDCIVRRG
ncbi:hypothetical protein VTO73DRAFT_11603 [Trametes versicolor]